LIKNDIYLRKENAQNMSNEIEGAGRKGYFFMYLIIGFLLFISLWAFIYHSNADFVVPT